MPAACHALEPRPPKAVEDEDDDEYENDFAPNAERRTPNAKRQTRTSPQPFDLLQHSFGDLADLARGQE
jgi:hypothetical protein